MVSSRSARAWTRSSPKCAFNQARAPVFEARLAALAEQVLHGGLLEALEPGLVGRQDDLPHGAVACSPPGIARALREALVELGRAAALLQLRQLVGEIGDGHLLNLGLDLPGPVLRAVEAPVLA